MRLSLVFADSLKVRYRYKTAGAGDQWIARFVPVGIVFPTDNVEEITLAEA